ncbi:MAG: DNA polymerase III subunit beta [Bacillota bacterium]
MHLLLERNNILSAMSTALRIVPSRSPLLITTGILLKAKENRLEITSTDLEVTIRCFTPVLEIYREGSLVIPARQAFEIVRRLADGKIEIEGQDNNVSMVYSGGELKINGFPVDEFPIVATAFEERAGFRINEGMKTALRSVLYAAGKDELRPVFTGIQFELREGTLTMAATDAHRLAVFEMPTDLEESYLSIIPAKALREVERALGQGEESVNVVLQQNHAAFMIDAVEIGTRLIEGRFPDWRAAIPQGPPKTLIKGETAGLIAAIERAQVLATGEASTVVVHVQEGGFTVSSQSESGGLKERVPLQVEGEDVEIAFNAVYLLDALRVAPQDTFELELNGSLGPALLKTSENKGFLALVLPLRML